MCNDLGIEGGGESEGRRWPAALPGRGGISCFGIPAVRERERGAGVVGSPTKAGRRIGAAIYEKLCVVAKNVR